MSRMTSSIRWRASVLYWMHSGLAFRLIDNNLLSRPREQRCYSVTARLAFRPIDLLHI